MHDTAPHPAGNAFPVLDLEAALEHTGGDRELLQQLCTVFAEECPKQLEEVRMAVTSVAPDSVRRAAHKIKGSASAVGGVQASQAALQLEKAALSGNTQLIQAAYESLSQAIGTLQTAILSLADSDELS